MHLKEGVKVKKCDVLTLKETVFRFVFLGFHSHSKAVSSVLLWFLGMLGGHWLYVRNVRFKTKMPVLCVTLHLGASFSFR